MRDDARRSITSYPTDTGVSVALKREKLTRQRGFHAGATKKLSIRRSIAIFTYLWQAAMRRITDVVRRITGWRYHRQHMGLMRLPQGQHAHQSAIAAGSIQERYHVTTHQRDSSRHQAGTSHQHGARQRTVRICRVAVSRLGLTVN
jgi:hypothetical protein